MKKIPFLVALFFLVSCIHTQAPNVNITQTLEPYTPQIEKIIHTATIPASFDISGRVLLYTTDALYLADADGSSPFLIHTVDTPLSMMSLSPDGTELAYFSGNFLYVKNIITGKIKILNQEIMGSIGGQLKWSPDGKRIALSCSTPSEPTISLCLIDENGNISFVLSVEHLIKDSTASSEYFIELQDWSQDGSKLFFTFYTPSEKGQKEEFSIYYYDLPSKTTQLVFDGKSQKTIFQIRSMSISTDNKTLLLSGMDKSSLSQVFVLDIATDTLSQPMPKASITTPVWTNDSCCFYVHVEQQDNLPAQTKIFDLDGNTIASLDSQGAVIQWLQ